MKQAFSNVLEPLGLVPANTRGRVARGFTVSQTLKNSFKLSLTDREILDAFKYRHSSMYVGTYATKALAESAGKALVKNKDKVIANVSNVQNLNVA